MGASTSRDIINEANNKFLNISRQLTPDQYLKHIKGECLEGSLLELPWEMYYNTVSLYENIDASFNFISLIPAQLSLHVPHLKHLNLSHNQLTSLPSEFQLLLHLRTLHLSYNRFKQFPTVAVTKLPHLHTLDISHNQLRELPQRGWHLMEELERFNVSHNQLHLLPNALSACPKLSVLVVAGNQLMHPPTHVCAMGSHAILHFLALQDGKSDKQLINPPSSPVFSRIRGDHVSASVSNPESACRQYQQGCYTAPGAKRKCPLMPPRHAQALPPHAFTQTIMGLVYGAVCGESLGLSCEGLSQSETQFHYGGTGLAPNTRIRDHLRSHYPHGDWGPVADLMLVTLESLLRWGGVADELEWAAQVHQWAVHGLPEVDDRPGHALSPLLKEVLSSDSYSASPHAAAEAVYRRLTHDPSLKQPPVAADAFVVSREDAGVEEGCVGRASLHANDNSCLPSALVLGLPSFSQAAEVHSNAERICRASHAAPLPRAAAATVARAVAAVLQGQFKAAKCDPQVLDSVLDDLLYSSIAAVPDSLEKTTLMKVWRGVYSTGLRDSGLPSCHVAHTLAHCRAALREYCSTVWGEEGLVASPVGECVVGMTGRSKSVAQTVSSEDGSLGDTADVGAFVRQLSDCAVVGSAAGILDWKVVKQADVDRRVRSRSVPVPRNVGYDVPLTTSNCANIEAPMPKVDPAQVFKSVLSKVCMEGGWGVCAHACVIGGLLGAVGGFDALPQDWLKTLAAPNRRYLHAKVNLLLDMFGLP